MSEADVKEKLVAPAIIRAGWSESQIKREAKMTDGRVEIKGNKTKRQQPKYADMLLHYRPNYPLAIIEVKRTKFGVAHGMQQAKEYSILFKPDGTRMDAPFGVPFVFSTNGEGFQEYDFLTGKERSLSLDEFPSPKALYERYLKEYRQADDSEPGATPEQIKIMEEPYYSSTEKSPRYYQRIAINRTVEMVARGKNRLLLVMATGTGKTYTAFQIVWRLLKGGLKHKILYLADRNVLVDQTIANDFSPLEKVTHKIKVAKDDPVLLRAYQVYFALYQQLDGDDETGDPPYERLFPPDFFDLIIVDECHRGSAKEDGRWRRILDYFSSATQIGMTATPKETSYVSNIDYFGEPIYTYSLREGIDDGFLAPFRVINVRTNVSEGWRPTEGQQDAEGRDIEDRIYNEKDYDRAIILQDRRSLTAQEITQYLKKTDRMAKTIVFCATEEHADRMRVELANLNADMMKLYPDYVVRITASDDYGRGKLEEFCKIKSKTPVIATTSELLSTGVDCKMVKLIVLDKMIGSMTQFKQILGRGTRLVEKAGKTSFVVMDFRNVTNLFADPNWDGPIKQDENFNTDDEDEEEEERGQKKKKETSDPGAPNVKPIVDADGCRVYVTFKKVSVYDVGGRLLRTESVRDYAKSKILGEYFSLDGFISEWATREKRDEIKDLMERFGLDLEALKEEEGYVDVDDFDYLCHVAFDRKPLTRRERAENVKKRDFLSKYSGLAREILEALVEKYADVGIDEIDGDDMTRIRILQTEPFTKYGRPDKIVALFGGIDGYLRALRELEKELYRETI